MKYLVETKDAHGQRLYLRLKNRYGEWTYWRWDAIRFDTRGDAEKAVKVAKDVREQFVVDATQNMDFGARPPAVVTRIRPKLIERAEKQYEERLREKA